jgi:hypothetical protein
MNHEAHGENFINLSKCQCGKDHGRLFECKFCEKTFCDNCPASSTGIDDEQVCLECIMIEEKILHIYTRKGKIIQNS